MLWKSLERENDEEWRSEVICLRRMGSETTQASKRCFTRCMIIRWKRSGRGVKMGVLNDAYVWGRILIRWSVEGLRCLPAALILRPASLTESGTHVGHAHVLRLTPAFSTTIGHLRRLDFISPTHALESRMPIRRCVSCRGLRVLFFADLTFKSD